MSETGDGAAGEAHLDAPSAAAIARGEASSLEAAAAIVRSRLGSVPRIMVVLGSGLGQLCARLEEAREVAFADLPGFPRPGVKGHSGRFVAGRLGPTDVLAQAGRYHLYEGHPMATVVAPVRLASELGVRTFVFTNAAGGIDPALGVGDLVRVADHVNLMFRDPLADGRGQGARRSGRAGAGGDAAAAGAAAGGAWVAEGSTADGAAPREGPAAGGPATSPYDAELARLADEAAAEVGLELHSGVYGAVLGPSFETPAEVRMLRGLGVDLVGMSTVPEVLVARACGGRCAALSMVTNQAAGLGSAAAPLDHAEVLAVGRRAGEDLWRLLTDLVGRLEGPPAPGGAAPPSGRAPEGGQAPSAGRARPPGGAAGQAACAGDARPPGDAAHSTGAK